MEGYLRVADHEGNLLCFISFSEVLDCFIIVLSVITVMFGI